MSNPVKEITLFDVAQYFEYLNELRDSGEVNMWLASSYLEDEFGIEPKDAKDALLAWIKSFSKGEANE